MRFEIKPPFEISLFSARAATALGALAVAGLLAHAQPAQAQACLLDTNENGFADTGIDNVAGGDAPGAGGIACGQDAEGAAQGGRYPQGGCRRADAGEPSA